MTGAQVRCPRPMRTGDFEKSLHTDPLVVVFSVAHRPSPIAHSHHQLGSSVFLSLFILCIIDSMIPAPHASTLASSFARGRRPGFRTNYSFFKCCSIDTIRIYKHIYLVVFLFNVGLYKLNSETYLPRK